MGLAHDGQSFFKKRESLPVERDTIQVEAYDTFSGKSQSFGPFPEPTLLESGNIPIADIATLALREGQSSSPIYRVHRWFARRLGSQFRAILTALSLKPEDAEQFWNVYLRDLSLNGKVVLDPFVGGGTSLVESSRCGARVIGYDIDPVASFITNFELKATTYNPSDVEISEFCGPVSQQLAPLHKTMVYGKGERVVLHHFWVECRSCDICGTTFEIHPHYQLAYCKEKGLQWVFCKSCHEVKELALSRKELRCECGTQTSIEQGTLNKGKVLCSSCGGVSFLGARGNAPVRPEWKLFAQEYLDDESWGSSRHFKAVREDDRLLYEKSQLTLNNNEMSRGIFAPFRNIPTIGRFDQRPLIHGFKKYRDLFNDRQLLHLTLLGQEISCVKNTSLRQILSIAFSEHLTTNCMYTAYAFGYRRISPMFSIHSYRHITRPVEINPWLDGIGRGTFPNVLKKILKAVTFAKSPTEIDPRGGRVKSTKFSIKANGISKDPRDVLLARSSASISTQSSEDLGKIPDCSIDLILTDPPYFDNLSYSELSDFYLAWHQSLGVAEPPYDDPYVAAPIRENLALTDRGEEAIEIYRGRLQRIFYECNRVLKENGLMVFTYHHKSPVAWEAVGNALAHSGLKCKTVLPMRGEGQGGLHSYDGTIKWDAVFVCRKGVPVQSTKADKKLVLLRESVDKAKLKAASYAEDLAKNKRIAFREPDRLNLECAMIVASAFISSEVHSQITLLSDALKTSSTAARGVLKHAKS